MQWLIDLVYTRVMLHFVGIIVKWSGAIVDIPTGWQLCDGTNGTPDLRDRFVIGAGTTYNPDDTGGTVDHSHQLSIGKTVAAGVNFGYDVTLVNHLPPYYALAFIQYIG